jgi:hypothetical protein
LIELAEKSITPSFKIYSAELLDENFTVLIQPGEPRVDYLRIERTPKGLERGASFERLKNVTTDPKTAVFGDHSRFSSYRHLVKTQERSHVTVFHFARNNKNNILGPWLVRAGVDAALESNPIELDTRENAMMVLESIVTPSLPIWTESDPLLGDFGGSYTTVEQSSPLTRLG